MKRIDGRTVELTAEEVLVEQIYNRLLEQGYGIAEAIQLLTAPLVPWTLKECAPELEAVLSDEFLEYLAT